MTTRRSSLTVVGCVIVLAGAMLACKKKKEETSSAPETPVATATAKATAAPPAAATKTFNVGDTATQIDYKLKVANVKECKANYYEKRKLKTNDQLLLGVEVEISSISDKTFHANSFNFKIVDSEGTVHKANTFMGKCEPRLSTTSLNKGEKAKGWVTFPVPKKGTGLKLSYQPTIILGPKQLTKFDLGR